MSNLEMDHDLRKFREKPQEIDMYLLAINLMNDFLPQAIESNKKIFVDDDSFYNVFGRRKIIVEKNLIAQAISNILENAIKYSHEDSEIKIQAEKDDHGICVLIKSVGIPIQQESAKKIFERGHREKTAVEKVPAGTGFGLYLVKRIMELHNGSVSVELNNKLSTFKLHFPENLIK